MKYNIITAKQANEKTWEAKLPKIASKLQWVLEKIYEAISKGDFYVRFFDSESRIDDNIIEILRQLGFKYEIDGIYEKISWESTEVNIKLPIKF